MAGIQELLSNPNFLQMLGNAGQTLANGGSVGEALNPSKTIADVQGQNATSQLLRQLLGGGNPQNAAGTQMPVNLQESLSAPKVDAQPYQAQDNSMQSLMDVLKGTEPTPMGQAGPNSRTIKQTADGHTITTVIPSARNNSTYGTSVPAESQKLSSGGGSGQSTPFLKALLG